MRILLIPSLFTSGFFFLFFGEPKRLENRSAVHVALDPVDQQKAAEIDFVVLACTCARPS